MKLLLDTHVLLWALIDPQRLGDGLQAALRNPAMRVHFSAASIWEVAIKRGLGRPDFPFEPDEISREALAAGFDALAIDHRHAARVRHLPLLHADPFDRLLLAQAQCEGAQLVTADRTLMDYPAPLRWISDF